jgi:hypothetical protein
MQHSPDGLSNGDRLYWIFIYKWKYKTDSNLDSDYVFICSNANPLPLNIYKIQNSAQILNFFPL